MEVIRKAANADAIAAKMVAFFFSIKAVRKMEIINPPDIKTFPEKTIFRNTLSRKINKAKRKACRELIFTINC